MGFKIFKKIRWRRPGREPARGGRHTSADGRALIEHYVGCRFEAAPDAQGVLTIGYGETEDVEPGDRIMLPEADERLRLRLAREVEPAVLAALVRDPQQHELDALVSLAHDVGVEAFQASALLRFFNADALPEATAAFGAWPGAPADAVPARRWRQRRAAEQALFRGLVFVDAIRIGDATE